MAYMHHGTNCIQATAGTWQQHPSFRGATSRYKTSASLVLTSTPKECQKLLRILLQRGFEPAKLHKWSSGASAFGQPQLPTASAHRLWACPLPLHPAASAHCAADCTRAPWQGHKQLITSGVPWRWHTIDI